MILDQVKSEPEPAAILGLLQNTAVNKSGRITVYGDSNCLDNSHLQKGILFQDVLSLYFRIVGNHKNE